jgi:hypothetical protein
MGMHCTHALGARNFQNVFGLGVKDDVEASLFNLEKSGVSKISS